MTLAKMAGLSVFLHPLCSGRRSATRIISTIACWTVNNVLFRKSAVLHFFGLQLMTCVALTKFDVTDP